MRNLIHEIHRRSLWQVLGIYLAVSWVVLQVIDVLGNNVGLPEWVGPTAFALLLVGLPIVIGTAFLQEGMTTRQPSPSASADTGEERPSPPSDIERRHRLFTWRNAVIGGVGAFALLGIATAAWLFMRTAGIGPAGTLVAAGLLDERDPILIAQMEAGSGDAALARTATEALRTDLAESPVVTLLSSDDVADALRRMRRDPDTELDLALAREVAAREGIKAVISGEVNVAGAGYVLTAQIISAADGSVLASRRESARDESEVVDAIDRLSRGVRERLGESLRSVQSGPPLARLTTASLEALEKYQEGNAALGRGDQERGMELLYEAVAIDTAFAAAWRRIATDLGNPGSIGDSRAEAIEAATKGWVYRDRLTEYEKVRAEAVYHSAVTGDYRRELAVYERGVERFPESGPLHNNLSVQYLDLEEFAKAEAVITGYHPGRDEFFLNINLIRSLAAQGRFDETEERAGSVSAGLSALEVYRFLPYAGRLRAARDWEGLEALADSTGSSGVIARLRGRVAETQADAAVDLAELERAGRPAEYLIQVLERAFTELDVRGRSDTAVELVDRALERHPLDALHPFNRPYAGLAEFYARVGRLEDARRYLVSYEAEVVDSLGVVWNRDWHRARSELALAEGRFDDAIAEQRLSEARPCRNRCPQLGRVYDLSGVPDSAIAVLGRYVDAPRASGFGEDARFMAWALERLGQLTEEQGRLQAAAEYYARFVDLWSGADEDLQPRVRAAQARLERILTEIG